MQGYSLIRADHPEDVKRVVSACILTLNHIKQLRPSFTTILGILMLDLNHGGQKMLHLMKAHILSL